jgi:broad specificity phosphatase PhoE
LNVISDLERRNIIWAVSSGMSQLFRTICGAFLLLFVACNDIPTPNIISKPGTTTTIIMVRHAERDPGLDPPLNAEGIARAQILADVLGQNGVTAIYTMDAIRNRETAQPLASKLGLTPSLVPVAQLLDTKVLAKRLVTEWLSKHSGGVVYWQPGVHHDRAERHARGGLQALGWDGQPAEPVSGFAHRRRARGGQRQAEFHSDRVWPEEFVGLISGCDRIASTLRG